MRPLSTTNRYTTPRSRVLSTPSPAAGLSIATAVFLSAGCLTALPGCSTAPSTRSHASASHEAQPQWSVELDRLAARQLNRPDRRAMSAPPPAGAPADLTNELTGDARTRASMSLTEALGAIAPAGAEPADAGADREVSERDVLEATRLYVSGRSRRLGGDYAGAEQDLRQAARLDPRSAEVWREYGETQLALGNQPLAHSAFRRAVARDPNDIRSLEALSKSAMDRRDYEAAASLIARMVALPTEEFDPALPAINAARLGRALIELGYLSAGAEALREALALPDQYSQSTNYIPDLTNVYRQRGDLWREIGDGAFRLGKFDQAADAYGQAATLPSLDPSATTARRVFAAMRLGQSAAAARMVLAEVAEADGRIDERRLNLLRSIATASAIDAELARAISGIGASLDQRSRRMAAGPLARAAAAVSSDQEALRILRARLAEAPADEATLRELLRRLDFQSPASGIQEVILLTDASPLHEARYARALVVAAGAAQPLLDAWPTVPTQLSATLGGRLLHARLLALGGELATANDELAALAEEHPESAAVIVARTSILNRLGRYDEAHKLLESLEASADAGVILARALALEELNDPSSALEGLTPLLPPQAATADVELLLVAARLSLQTGRAEDAEAWLNQVLEIDSTRDEAYAMLLALYGASGPLANERLLLETVRAMRDADPQSPTLRLLRAQESLARRQFDVADRELRALVEEYPDRPDALHTLSQVWRASASLESGEEWTRAQIAARPGHTALTLLLADVLVASRREREAVALLEEALERAPGDDSAARALESTLRMIPGEEKRAEAMTEARLSRSPSSPDTYLELVELALRRNDVKQAITWMEGLAELNRALTPVIRIKCEQLAQAVADQANRGRIDADPALALHEHLLKQVAQPQKNTLLGRIVLLLLTNAPIEEIIAATDSAAAAFPNEREGIYMTIANELWANGRAEAGRKARPKDSVALLERATETMVPPPLSVLTQWVLRVTPGFGTAMDMSEADRMASVIRAFNRAQQADMLTEVVVDVAARLRNDRGAMRAADLAQFLSTLMDQVGEEQMAERLLRVAIQAEPDHVWANNNLGYRLLNEGRDLDDAHAMIERAYRAMQADQNMGDRSSVTDSLGWARYKLGIIYDELPDGDEPGREGAITLLARALALAHKENEQLRRLQDPGRQNREQEAALAIISDHTGDAMWIGGRREEAIAMWTEAAARAESTLKQIDESDLPNLIIRREIEDAMNNAQAKLQAAREDRQPATASMFRPANTPPAAVTPSEAPAMID